MDHRKYQRLRGKAANIFEETTSLRSRLSFCRRHFLSVTSSRSLFQQQRQVSARQMTMSLAVAAVPLFDITDRQATNLWAASMQTSSEEENDLRCLENFIQAINEDLEFVIKLVDKSVSDMATPGKRQKDGGQGNDKEDDVEAWRRRYFELIEDMETFLSAIDGLDVAIEAANIREPSSRITTKAPFVGNDVAMEPKRSASNSHRLPPPSRSSSSIDNRSLFNCSSGSDPSRFSHALPQNHALPQKCAPLQQLFQPKMYQEPITPQVDQRQHTLRLSTRTIPSVSPVQDDIYSTVPAPPRNQPFPAHGLFSRGSRQISHDSATNSIGPSQQAKVQHQLIQQSPIQPQHSQQHQTMSSLQPPPLFRCDVESSRLAPLSGPTNEAPLSPIRAVSPILGTGLDHNNNIVEEDGYGFGPYIAPLELPVGTNLKLDVSFFNSPWSLFVFLPDNNVRDYIADRMTKFYNETDEGRDHYFPEIPKPGTTVAVYYCDKTWNRGVVLNILPPEEVKHSNFLHQDRALVFFLDYGNTERCPLNYIRKLSNCFTYFNAQTAPCALAGIGPVGHDQWTKFHINTHQYIMADEFEDNLNGRIEVEHGRRFLELKAFKGTSVERSMADLLMDNDLAEPLEIDAMVKQTAFPTPCPSNCQHHVTMGGECRHGFVVTPVENLGVFARLKTPATLLPCGEADFGFGNSSSSSATKHSSSASTVSSSWNSKEKLPELLRLEMVMFYDESQKEEMEDHISQRISLLKRTKSSTSGLNGAEDCFGGAGGEEEGDVETPGSESLLRPRRRGSKTIITVPLHMRDVPSLQNRENVGSGFEIPKSSSSLFSYRPSSTRAIVNIPTSIPDLERRESSESSSSPLSPSRMTKSLGISTINSWAPSFSSSSGANVGSIGTRSGSLFTSASSGSSKPPSGSPFCPFSPTLNSSSSKMSNNIFSSRPASDGSNRDSIKSKSSGYASSDAVRSVDILKDTKARSDFSMPQSAARSDNTCGHPADSFYQPPKTSAFKAFNPQQRHFDSEVGPFGLGGGGGGGGRR